MPAFSAARYALMLGHAEGGQQRVLRRAHLRGGGFDCDAEYAEYPFPVRRRAYYGFVLGIPPTEISEARVRFPDVVYHHDPAR
jgi:hypothetical protein